MSSATRLLMMLAIWTGTPETESDQLVSEPAADTIPDSTGESTFRAAVAAFDARDFARAADLFERAYRISKAPALLFNLGQAYRVQGNCKAALDAYNRFLLAAGPTDPLRERVQVRRSELRGCALPAPIPPVLARAPTMPPISTPGPALVELRVPSTQQPRGAWIRTACITAGATSAALGAVSLGLGIKSWSIARSVEKSEAWNTATQRADARGNAFANTSAALLLLSGVAATVTAATCWLGWVTYR